MARVHMRFLAFSCALNSVMRLFGLMTLNAKLHDNIELGPIFNVKVLGSPKRLAMANDCSF